MTQGNTGDVSLVFNGIGNFTSTITVAGDYVVQGQLSLPSLTQSGSDSAVQTVVKLNSTTKLTGVAGATGFKVDIPGCAVGDVIHIITSSSNAIDNALNAVKLTAQIFQGEQ